MNYYKNKKVLLTGGTGSLGKALCHRLNLYGAEVLIYSRDEGKQAALPANLYSKNIIGDVRDLEKLDKTLKNESPDFLIHTAALKRIDDMEFYPDECVKTNIIGSENVAKAALRNEISKCILISTDKACQPINVYGSTKFIAERIFSNYDYNSNSTTFSSVRYGNVIASRGSFVPLFIDLIKNDQEIKVTSTEMTRFLFTLEDACDTVLLSLANSAGGEVFVPKINSFTLPTCIKALSKILNKEAKTKIVGLRPGEKLHEDMLAESELPFSYKVDGSDLIQIRPQISSKQYQDFQKYKGPHFNSKLWVSKDLDLLTSLFTKACHEII